MSSLFISYTRQNQAAVRRLVGDVNDLGHTTWFDEELSGGQAWWERILLEIRQCNAVILALAPDTVGSSACTREYEYAAALGKPILPVVVAEGVSPRLLPPELSKLQLVAYMKQDKGEAVRLARALAALPAPPPLPNPLPAPPEVPISYLGELTKKVDSVRLDYEEQSALVMDLRRSLQDMETRKDARILLDRLRKRRDLFATIAEDIDAMTDGQKSSSRAVDAYMTEPPRQSGVESSPSGSAGKVSRPLTRAHPAAVAIRLLLTGPIGWTITVWRHPTYLGALFFTTLLTAGGAVFCFASGDGIDGFDDDVWEYSGIALLAVMWLWPFASPRLLSCAFGNRAEILPSLQNPSP